MTTNPEPEVEVVRSARRRRTVSARREGGDEVGFDAVVRIDTPGEAGYYRHGGIMPYVLRSLRTS